MYWILVVISVGISNGQAQIRTVNVETFGTERKCEAVRRRMAPKRAFCRPIGRPFTRLPNLFNSGG
jgi:hypothetical protein